MIRAGLAAALVALAALAIGGCAAPGADAGPGTAAPRGDLAGVLPDKPVESDERQRARTRLELAASYYQQGNYTIALEELRQALLTDPGYAAALGLLGLIYMDMGDRPRAEESFQRALRLAPNDSDLNNNYGWFLCQSGRERESIDFFQRALRNPLYRTPARPLHNAGICSLRVGDEAGAEAFFRRSFQVDPSNPVAMYQLARMYLSRGQHEQARFYARRLLNTFEPTAETLWLALRVERAAGNREAEVNFGAQLRRRFPQARETGLLAAGDYRE